MLRLTPCDWAARLTQVTRWALATLGALLVLGIATVAFARFFGKSGSRASIGVSVVSHWLAAYLPWSFPARVAPTFGPLATSYSAAFAAVCLLGAVRPYPAPGRAGRRRGRKTFRRLQLARLGLRG